MITFNENKSSKQLELSKGHEAQIIKSLQKVLNFTYDIIDCDMDFGNKLPDNQWTGILGQLQRNV